MAAGRLRIVFFGTAEFAVPSLDALIGAGHEILAVVTQPDKPHGRGMKVASSPVKVAAERAGLPVLQPKRVRAESFLDEMRALAPDLLALAAFGQIIPQALLDLPPLGPINVHGSLLPRYRGAAPIQRALMAGETEMGVTTMWMEATLDTGDMLMWDSIAVEPNDTAGTITPKLAAVGASLLVETVDGLAGGTLTRTPQNDALSTLAPAIKPNDSNVRWDDSAETIRNRVRGLSPKPGAFTSIEGRRVKIWSCDVLGEDVSDAEPGVFLGYSKQPPGVIVAAGDGTRLLLAETQPDNGKRMAAADWARGLRLATGMKFT